MNSIFNQTNRTQHTNELFQVLLYANKNNKVTFNELLIKEVTKLSDSQIEAIILDTRNTFNEMTETTKYLDIVMTCSVFTNILLECDKLQKEDKKWYFALDKREIVNAYKTVLNDESNPYYYSKVLELLIISIKYFNDINLRNEIYVLLSKQLHRLIEDYKKNKTNIYTLINIFYLLKENKYKMEYFADEQNMFIASINYKDLLNITVEKFKQTMTITPYEYALLFNKYQKLIKEYPHNDLHIYSFMMCLKYAEMTSSERKHLSDYYDEKYKDILNETSLKIVQKQPLNNFENITNISARNIHKKINNANIDKKRQDKLAKLIFRELNTEYLKLLFQNVKENYSQQIHTNDKSYIYYAEPKNIIKKFDIIDSYQTALMKNILVNLTNLLEDTNLFTDGDVSLLFNNTLVDNPIISNTLMFEIINLYEKENWKLFVPLMKVCLTEIYKTKKQNHCLPNNIHIKSKFKEELLHFSKEDKERFFKQNNCINCINSAVTEYLLSAEYNKTTATILMLYFTIIWYL